MDHGKTSPLQERIARTLGRGGWFARRPASLQESLVRHAQVSTAESGEWLYDTGDEAHGLFAVLSGSVLTHVVLENGERVLVSLSGPGTIFGYAAQVLGGRRLTTAIARERSEIIFIPQHAIATIVHNMPALWLHFAELATEQLTWTARAYAERLTLAPKAQIASRLYSYTFAWGERAGRRTRLPLRQDELAELMGFSRKTVNGILRDLEDHGLIATGYREIDVLDPDGLRRLAAAPPKPD